MPERHPNVRVVDLRELSEGALRILHRRLGEIAPSEGDAEALDDCRGILSAVGEVLNEDHGGWAVTGEEKRLCGLSDEDLQEEIDLNREQAVAAHEIGETGARDGWAAAYLAAKREQDRRKGDRHD